MTLGSVQCVGAAVGVTITLMFISYIAQRQLPPASNWTKETHKNNHFPVATST